MLRNVMLKFVFEYLAIAVDNELIADDVKHDPSSRPLLIFRVAQDVGDGACRALCSPAFPYFAMAARTRDEVSVFLGCG